MGKEYTRAFSLLDFVPNSGQILHYSNFEGPLELSEPGGLFFDEIFELDPTTAFSGTQCLHIKTRTTGAAADDHIDPTFDSYILPPAIITSSFRFKSPNWSTYGFLGFTFTLRDGSLIHIADFQFDVSTPEILISGVTTLENSDISLADDAWHFLEFSVDFSTDSYRHLIIDDRLFDLSSLPIPASANAEDQKIRSQIGIQTVGAAPVELFIDELLFHGI